MVRRTKLNLIREEFWKNVEGFDSNTCKDERVVEVHTYQSIDDVGFEHDFSDDIGTTDMEDRNVKYPFLDACNISFIRSIINGILQDIVNLNDELVSNGEEGVMKVKTHNKVGVI